MKTCPICRSTFENKAALAAHMASVHPARRGQAARRNRGGGRSVQAGTTTFSRVEYLGKSKAKNIPLQPGATGLRQLDNFAAVFENYRWDKISVKVKSTVGSTASGMYFLGVSYESDHIPKTDVDIAACSPALSSTVTRDGTLVVPVRPLMGQPWLSTKAATGEGKAGIAGYVNLVGDEEMAIWVDYTVTLSGPTSVSRTVESGYLFSKLKEQWTDGDGHVIDRVSPSSTPIEVDVEVDSGDASTLETVMSALRSVYANLREFHRWVVDGVTFIHAIADAAGQAGLVALPVATIVHQRALPFRVDPRLERGGERVATSASGCSC